MQGRRSPSLLIALVLPAVLAAVGGAVHAQSEVPETPGRRPSVGLVLSGGGARGGAHIGVLRALQELRVPVDYIAGTSIGAIVGGFYASGMTVPDMTHLVESLEWERAFLNSMPRQRRSFRRKRDDDLFLVDQKPGLVDGEFRLPLGLNQGQVFDTIISRETLRASEVHDFDRLVIPFRAVAGDIATGEAVVLSSGSLAKSLRASMSIPAVLAPVEIDGRLLVDGGIAMNLPVDVARKMGADRVIAVDVASPLLERDELRSVVDVTTQLTNLLTRAGSETQRDKLTSGDVLLRPEFAEDFSSVSFAKMSEAIQAGYDAVMMHRDEFRDLELSEPEYAAYQARHTGQLLGELPVIDFVRLDNKGPVADSIVETRLRDIKIGEPLNVDAVERAVDKVYGLEYYQNVRYGLVTDGDKTGLEVELDERAWGPNYVQLGVEYSSAANEDTLFGLAASYLSTAINDRGGEWRGTLIVGDEPALLTDLYQPLGRKGLFFYAPALRLESNQFNVFSGDQRVLEAQRRQATLEFAAGRELPSWAEYRFGIREASGTFKLRVGDEALLPPGDFRLGEFFGRFSVDTVDSVSFPREGTLASVEWRGSRQSALGADADFDQVLVSAAHAKTWGRHTLLTTLRYDATISGIAPVSQLFRMGGFLDLSGINRNELSGQYATRLGASYYRRIGDLALFPAFAGVSLEVGNVWQSRGDISLERSVVGGSFWAGISTPIGPVYVGYGRAEGGADAFYVSLGRVF
jgi:NTE family protein